MPAAACLPDLDAAYRRLSCALAPAQAVDPQDEADAKALEGDKEAMSLEKEVRMVQQAGCHAVRHAGLSRMRAAQAGKGDPDASAIDSQPEGKIMEKPVDDPTFK